MTDYYLAWWNVENLFSVASDPTRSPKLQRKLRAELTGWDASVLGKKLDQLASVISQMNGSTGPDILGVCEVENQVVLSQLAARLTLAGRKYKVVHSDSKDSRGIDVAFIYDSNLFKIKPSEVFNHFILRRNATRDLVQVSFYTKPGNNRLVLVGNHWPSRLGGELESEPYRIIAAETLSYFHERIIEILTKDQAVIVMGDFNDEPFSRSLVQYALSEKITKRVKSARSQNPYLLNLMWPLLGDGQGTHYYDGLPGMLDQLLVNRPLLRSGTSFSVKTNSVEIIRFPGMAYTSGANKNGPRRFGRPSSPGSFDPSGYSDHFPIGMTVTER
jgi:predicted extracellular nuclease